MKLRVLVSSRREPDDCRVDSATRWLHLIIARGVGKRQKYTGCLSVLTRPNRLLSGFFLR